jgi:hypothetical protein
MFARFTPLFLSLWLFPGLALPQPVGIPRTEYGFPDLQGIWTNASQTPLQRPTGFGNKRFFTSQEAREQERQALVRDQDKAAPLEENRQAPEAGEIIRFQADENFANTRIDLMQVHGEYRTSLVVDPPNGQLPYRPGGQSGDVYGQWLAAGAGVFDGPEIRNPWERCFFVGGQLPPMIAWTYNANFQIIQNRDYVVIAREMVHDARIIRIEGEPFPASLVQWSGNSVGTWEGDVLVVESENFHPQASHPFIRSSADFKVSERFTLLGANEILYQYTVNDPQIYEQPFTVEMTLRRKAAGERIYEYACHEGNYSLPAILAGARREELDAEFAR